MKKDTNKKQNKLNTPNRLTLLRIALAPVFLAVLVSNIPHSTQLPPKLTHTAAEAKKSG